MTKDYEYTRSIIHLLKVVDEDFAKCIATGELHNFNFNTSCSSEQDNFIEWERVRGAVLPEGLRYLAGLRLKKRRNPRTGSVEYY